MRLISLQGEYFGQYPKLGPIYFPKKGTIGILGKTGAGKSTILEAIEIATFGSVSNKKISEIKYQEAKKSQKWWVELIFEKDGVQYRVIRHETTSKALLQANGKDIQAGQKDVTEHITRTVLKMDQTAFLNAFYAKQDEVENLNKLKPEERKREISKLLRFDKIDKAIEKARADKNKLNTQIEEQSRFLIPATHFKEKEEELKSAEQKINDEVKSSQKTLSKLEKLYGDYNTEVARLDSAYNKYQKYMSEYQNGESEQRFLDKETLPKLNLSISQLKEEKKKIPVLKETLKSLPELENQVSMMESQKLIFERKKFLMDQIETLKTKLSKQKQLIDQRKNEIVNKDFQTIITELEKELASLISEVENGDKKLMELNSTLYLVTEDGKRKRKEHAEIMSLGAESTCPVCKRDLGEHHHHLVDTLKDNIDKLLIEYDTSKKAYDDFSAKLKQRKEKQHQISSELSKVKGEYEQNKFKESVLNSDRITFNNMKEEYVRIETELKTFSSVDFNENDFNKLKNKYNELIGIKNQFEIIQSKTEDLPALENDFKAKTDRLNQLKGVLEEINLKVKELNFNKEQYEDLKKKSNDIITNLRSSERKVLESKQSLDSIRKELKDLKNKKKENEKINVSLQERKEEFGVLLYLDEVYKNYKIDKIAKISPTIEKVMQNMLSYLTDGKYDLVELDNSYKVFVYRNGIKQPLNMFSGGERKLISLVQRLAISQLIISQNGNQEFDFLCLDEVFGSLDEDLQESVLQSLTRLNDVFPQTLMISHNQNLNDMFDYTLRIEQKADFSSEANWTTDWDEDSVKETIIKL